MGRLTTKQRFALIFTLYVLLSLVVLYLIFFFIFNLTAAYQLKRDLNIEAKEIIVNNLILDKNSLIFKKNQAGATLKEYLLAHNTSAVFLDKDKRVLRRYGLFALGNIEIDNSPVSQLTDNAISKTAESNLMWENQEITASTVPLKKNGKVVGYMVLGKSLEEFSSLKNMMTLIFASLGLLSLIGSLLVGYVFSRRAFSPLDKMIDIIEKIELDKLDSPLLARGHPDDELVRLAHQFNKMLDRLKDMSQRQKAFIANASHELRTPLTRAISSFELLSAKENNKEETEIIRKNFFQIDAILDKLLLLTKLRKDIQLVKPYLLQTEELFETLNNNFSKEISEKELSFYKDVPKEVTINIPYEYLLIVMSNLISNAIRYSTFRKKLFLIMEKEGSHSVMTIKDEGLGMTEEESKHMFDRFYRGKGGGNGYGIGLSLVKQICDLYDVKISVNSEKGKGTSISLHLPDLSS